MDLKKLLRFNVIAPVILLLVAWLTYGLLIRGLGLYWDDFPYTWFGHVLGANQYSKVFYDERPLLTLLYNLTAPIFGENILAWQIFAIVMRWISTLCAGWLVRLIWPEEKEAAFVASLLFLVYPGFGQQWISTIYSRGFILLCFLLLSLIFMVKSLQNPRMYFILTGLSVIFGALALLSSEYYFGLEFARPVIIWIIISRISGTLTTRLKSSLLHWSPYLVGVLAFGIWRGLLVQSSLYDVNITRTSNGGIPVLLLNLVVSMITNAYKGGLQAWIQIFSFPPVQKWQQQVYINFFILITIVFIIFAWIGWKYSSSKVEHKLSTKFWVNWQIQFVILGLIMLLVGSLPMWVANLPFDLIFPYDRFMLVMMLGSALFWTGIIYSIRYKLIRIVVLCVMVALSAGWHYQTANDYRIGWNQFTTFLQQITWRIPGMKPGTMLVAYELPFRYYSDNSLTAPINWTYAPGYKGGNLPYVFLYLTVRENGALKQLDEGIEIEQEYRSLKFYGNTSNMIVLYQPEKGCLRVLDKIYTGADTIPNFKEPLPKAIKLSNLDRIISEPEVPARPIPEFFDQSRVKPWCYYFEKAELARQVGDFAKISDLWEQTKEQSLAPDEISEYYPFIEGLGIQGKFSEAIELSRKVNEKKKALHNGLCQIWDRVENGTNVSIIDRTLIDEHKIALRCGQ
jgi:hypothetical protein